MSRVNSQNLAPVFFAGGYRKKRSLCVYRKNVVWGMMVLYLFHLTGASPVLAFNLNPSGVKAAVQAPLEELPPFPTQMEGIIAVPGPRPWYKKKWIWVGVIALVGACAALCNDDDPPRSSQATDSHTIRITVTW